MRQFLPAPLVVALFGVLLIGTSAPAHAATTAVTPLVLAIAPAPARASCTYRLDTTRHGVTTLGTVRLCLANTLQHTLIVTESVAKTHQWSYLPISTSAARHPDGSVRFNPSTPVTSPIDTPPTAIQLCPMALQAQHLSPHCSGGGNPPACTYFQNLWMWANFGDGAAFSANVAYTVDCGSLLLNWSQIGQFGGYSKQYTLAFVDDNVFQIAAFWQAIPQRSYSFQGYDRQTSLGGDFAFATYNNQDWTDWDFVNMGNLW